MMRLRMDEITSMLPGIINGGSLRKERETLAIMTRSTFLAVSYSVVTATEVQGA
jgi:hypothetical protein